jgi:O-antigen/teichoic acid export membrane protein
MKLFAQRIVASPLYARAFEWGKLLTITGSAQVMIQALGLVGGVLVIRILPTKEYALYTLANAMLGTMTVLGDGGVATGVLTQAGRVWQDKQKLGSILATGFQLLGKFAIFAFLLLSPALFFLLHHHGASLIMSGLITLALIPSFITIISSGLLGIAPGLKQDIIPFQVVQVKANLSRLLILIPTITLFPWAFLAILVAGLPQVWVNKKMKSLSASYVDWNQLPNSHTKQDILALVKRVLPESIYYCFSGYLTIWLVSIFGSTNSIAQVGALGRITMALVIITSLFNTLVSPRFARLPHERNILLVRYLQIQAGLIILSVIIIFMTKNLSAEILWVFGKDYSNLEQEILLSITAGCINMIYGASFTLCSSRGWIIHPAFYILFNICVTICGILLFDVSSLQQVLMLNIFIVSMQAFIFFIYTITKIVIFKNVIASNISSENI